MRAAFVGIALVTLLYHLLPLDLSPRRWAGPDLIMAIAFAWVLRRPEYVPALSIGIVFFVADLLYLNPPGLLAALVVIACESLKSRARSLSSPSAMDIARSASTCTKAPRALSWLAMRSRKCRVMVLDVSEPSLSAFERSARDANDGSMMFFS